MGTTAGRIIRSLADWPVEKITAGFFFFELFLFDEVFWWVSGWLMQEYALTEVGDSD